MNGLRWIISVATKACATAGMFRGGNGSITGVHGQDTSSATEPVTFGSEKFPVTGSAKDVPVVVRQVVAVQSAATGFVR